MRENSKLKIHPDLSGQNPINQGVFRMKHIIPCFLLALVILNSCTKNPTSSENETPPLTTKGVYVVNEGNFGRGNSTLTFYLPDSAKVFPNVFETVNGKKLGDVGNDMVTNDDKGFIVVNNSDKVEVINLNDNRSLRTISFKPGSSPYKMTVGNGMGYVTNLYRAAVTVVNVTTLQIVRDSIPVGQNPTGALFYDSKVYVCNSGFGFGNTISVVNVASMTVMKTIRVSDGPSSLGVDSDGELWVLCGGSYGDFSNPNDDTPGRIFIINPTNDTVKDSILVGGHPSNLVVSNDGVAYFLKDGILRADTKTNQITFAPFIAGSFYGLAIDPASAGGDIYASDAKDFQQNGEVRIYDKTTGAMKNKFQAGIIPGTIAFKR
jgi:YVTN family beta-propeller protein